MSFLIETVIIAVIVYLITAILNRFYKKGSPSLPAFPWVPWVFGHLIVGAFFGSLTAAFQGTVFGGIGNWALLGASIGIMQWIVLKRFISVGNFWAVSSTLGWSAFAAFQALHVPNPLDWFLTGILIGILQWFCLNERTWVTAWWVLSNGFAWLVGGFLGIYVSLVLLQGIQNPIFSMVLGWGITGLIVASILGITMVKMKQNTEDRVTGNVKKERRSGVDRRRKNLEE